MYNALLECEEFIEQFGGHKYAAGLTLDTQKFSIAKETLLKVILDYI